MMYTRSGGTNDVGFARFQWQRPMHREDSSHLPQCGKAHNKLESKPFRLDHDMADPM